jgi:hypothetical protein
LTGLWTDTGDPLWDAYGRAVLQNTLEGGIDPETLIVHLNAAGESPALLSEAQLEALKPQFADDSRYWELCYWCEESRLWLASLEAERAAQADRALKSAAQLPLELQHPWPYFAAVEQYLAPLRQLAAQGKATPAARWILFRHDLARVFWQERAAAESHGKLPTLVNELSPAGQEAVIALLEAQLAQAPDDGLLLSWRAVAASDLGDAANARKFSLLMGDHPADQDYQCYPLSRVLRELGAGGSLGISAVANSAANRAERPGQVLVAGMVLAKTDLFPPLPLGVKVLDGLPLRKLAAASHDAAWLNAWHRFACRSIALATVFPQFSFGDVDESMSGPASLAMRTLAYQGAALNEDQRFALAVLIQQCGKLRARQQRALTTATLTPLPVAPPPSATAAGDTTPQDALASQLARLFADPELPQAEEESGSDSVAAIAFQTHSLPAYVWFYVRQARYAAQLADLAPELEKLSSFDYATVAWPAASHMPQL